MDKIVFVFNNPKSISYTLFNCLGEEEKITIIDSVYRVDGKIKYFLYDYFNYKPYFLFKKTYQIKDELIKNAIVVFDNESLSHLHEKKLKRIKTLAKGVCVFFIDEFSNNYSSIKNAKKYFFKGYFDCAYTYSQHDSNKFGLVENMSYYPKIHVPFHFTECNNDVFFIGNVKKRGKIIENILNYLEKNNVKTDFYIAGDFACKNKYTSIKYISYKNSIEKMLKSNCILDISDPGTCGLSLRYFEAIAYNKKLLTNNLNIKKMPYYNPKFIKIFDSINDIDVEWIIKKEKVDYGYSGEFEPINFVKKIMEYYK